MTVIAEIDQIISLLEAEIPANINSPGNQRLEKRLQRDLAKYFKALSDAFPYDQIDQLYYRHVKESLGTEAEDIFNPLLTTLQSSLLSRLNGHLIAVYISASAEMVVWGKTQAGLPIVFEGPPIGEAVNWASKHCAKLVTQMTEETKSQLAKVISDGIANKRGIPGLARDIRKSFDGMSKYRSQLIARTETANALGEAFLQRGEQMGIEGKEWVTAGGDACEICLENEAVGVIPFNATFPSGHMTVPSHPSCRCVVAPARLSR